MTAAVEHIIQIGMWYGHV